MRMPPEKVATAVTITSKSREISGCMRRSWYSERPPAMRPIPSSSAGLKSTFTIALVVIADAQLQRRLWLLYRACQAARLQLTLVESSLSWQGLQQTGLFGGWCITMYSPLRTL